MNKKEASMVFYDEIFERNYNYITDCFKRKFENIRLAYSFKTNYAPYICKLAKELGCYAEVVSPFEYDLAKNYGFKDKDIIYNGVCKDITQAFICAKEGGKVNINSLSELKSIIKIAERNKTHISVGLRVNYNIFNNLNSRFGIPIYSAEFDEAIELLSNSEFVNVNGLHSHFSKARGSEYWELRAIGVSELYEAISKHNDIFNIDFVDFGGNMYQTPFNKDMIKNFDNYCNMDEYAVSLYDNVNDSLKKKEIILECGTPLVADSISALCNVLEIREINGEIFVQTDISKFDLGLSCTQQDLPFDILPVGFNRNDYKTVKFVGYTCIEDDVILTANNINLAVGDIIKIDNVGAYSISQASNFICPTLQICCNNQIIKEKSDIYNALIDYKY